MTHAAKKTPKLTVQGLPNPALPPEEYASFFGKKPGEGSNPRWRDCTAGQLERVCDLAGHLGMLTCVGNGRQGNWLSLTIIHDGNKRTITAESAKAMDNHLSRMLLELMNLSGTEELEL